MTEKKPKKEGREIRQCDKCSMDLIELGGGGYRCPAHGIIE